MAPRTKAAPVSPEDILGLLADIANQINQFVIGQAPGQNGNGKATKDVAPDDDDEDETEEAEDDEVEVSEEEAERETELKALTIAGLRKIAKEHEIETTGVSKADLVEAILDAEFGEEGEDEDEDGEEEDPEDDEDGEDEAEEEVDLTGMTLVELRAHAKTVGLTAADYKGLDKDGLIALINGDEDEDEDEEDGEDEDDEDSITEEELKAKSIAEIKALAKEYSIKLKPGMKKEEIIDAILEEFGVDEDEG